MTFAREGLIANRAELEPLFEQHWAYVTPDFENVELGFDWEAYGWMEQAGRVHLMCCRDENKLVGYQMTLGQRHLHSVRTQVGHTAFFFLSAGYQDGFLLSRLFRESEKSLRALGIQSLYLGYKADRNLAPLLVRMGYHHVETIYAKEL